MFSSLVLCLFLLLHSTHGFTSFRRYRNAAYLRCALSQGDNEAFLTSVFGRLTDNYLLLDIEGAGTPEMMNCCHSGNKFHSLLYLHHFTYFILLKDVIIVTMLEYLII